MTKSNIEGRIGVLGGGQLGKMLAQAAADLNLRISVLDPTPSSPASCCATQVIGDFKNYDDLMRFGQDQDIITIEIENVNLDALIDLQKEGKQVYPDPKALKLIKDKGLQKLFYQQQDLPTSGFELFNHKNEIIDQILHGALEFPFVQKSRTEGYDGKGVQIIKSKDDIENLFDNPSIIETKVDIDKEIAVVTARNTFGEVIAYDPVEMIFHPTENLLLYQECPSTLRMDQINSAKALAIHICKQMQIVGLLAVEMFLTKDGEILVNEVAPRPHNSGHHTIEACRTSQFHQHLRCILGFPLGDASTIGPSILLNVLGAPGHEGNAIYQGLDACLDKPGVYVHLYGKHITKPYRKMGHVTIVGNEMNEVKGIADFVNQTLKVIS